jgi:hypothetical protein
VTLPVFPTLPGLTYTLLKTPGFDTLVMTAPNKYEVRIQQTINPIWSFQLVFDFLHDFFWGGQFAVLTELRTLMGFFTQMGGKAGSFLFIDTQDYSVGPALSTATWQASTYYPLNFGILDSSNHWQQVSATTTGVTGSTLPTFSHTGGTTVDGGVTWTDKGAYSSSGFPNVPLASLPLVTDGVGNWYSPIQRSLNGVFYEDITDLNGSITVYLNAVLQTSSGGSPNYSVAGPGLAAENGSYMGMYIAWVTGFSAWTASHTYATNAEILDPAGHIQKATTGGTSGSTIPVFNDSGGTTTDNGVTWTDQGYNPGPTGPVTAAFNFYFRLRFDMDDQDFERFCGTGSATAFPVAGQGGGISTIGGSESQLGSQSLKLVTARPTPL